VYYWQKAFVTAVSLIGKNYRQQQVVQSSPVAVDSSRPKVLGSGVVTLGHAEVQSQGDELHSQVMSGAEEGTEPREKSQKKADHGPLGLHDTVHGKAGSASR
jgi:hypothetical protein